MIELQGQALSIDDVGAGQIQTSGRRGYTRIADVADVVEAPTPAFGDALIDGKPGVLVDVARQYGANALDTTHAVERALAVLQPTLAAQLVVSADIDRPASFTTRAMRGIALDLAVGAALIALVLVLFLRDPRAVIISLVSIPLSLLAAVVALKACGWTLNSMTLGGLAVGLGVVIDDAVIGVENVVARLREAEHNHASDLEAVLAASLEVRGPVIYATVAAIVVLAPLLALNGLQGALLAPLAAAVIAVSLASLLVATVVTPALGLLFHQHEGHPAEPQLLHRVKAVHGAWLTRLCASAGFADPRRHGDRMLGPSRSRRATAAAAIIPACGSKRTISGLLRILNGGAVTAISKHALKLAGYQRRRRVASNIARIAIRETTADSDRTAASRMPKASRQNRSSMV